MQKYRNGHKQAEVLPPHSVEAEEAVLGSLIIDPDAIYQVGDFLRPNDFYTGKNSTVYETILELTGRGAHVDPVTLGEALADKTGEPINEWIGMIAGLINAVPTSIAARDYGRIVEEKAIRRRMIESAGKIAGMGYDETGSISEQLDTAETAIFQVRGERSKDGVSKPRQYASEYLATVDRLRDSGRGIAGLPTGFIDLDRLLSGFQAHYQYVLAARPGMGKSAMAINIATHLTVKHKKRIALFTLEMSKKQVMDRAVSSLTRIDSRRVQEPWQLTEEELQQVYEAAGIISDSKLFIDPTESQSPAEIRAKCMRLYAEHGLDLVIIDHLHLMRPDRNLSRPDLEIGEVSWSLANLGKTLNTPILTLAQLSRGVESRQNKRPQMSDLRESGRIEENAFVVMFLYRDEYYNEMTDKPNTAEINVAKNREGPTGTIDLNWDPTTVTFRNAHWPAGGR